jgi:hypothetical protein
MRQRIQLDRLDNVNVNNRHRRNPKMRSATNSELEVNIQSSTKPWRVKDGRVGKRIG